VGRVFPGHRPGALDSAATDAAHDNPAFGALVTAAGGADRVPAFCSGLLADKPGKSGHTPDRPTHPNR
jgi:hypothetical protein